MSDAMREAELHRRAMDVLRAAMDATPVERERVIESACANDDELREEVRSLLDSHERAGAFLEKPAARPVNEIAVDDAHMLIGKRIGRYVIVSLLGRGGMGAVFLAEQDEPRRQVALKILPAAMLAFSRDALRRFRQEAKVLARLQHPGIASIYEAGTHDDGSGATPFFAMEHIAQASPITTFARSRHLGLNERLRLFLQTCDAVQYGHQRGVIHRDLKPANMLVNADGMVKIIDFGIARLLSDDDATDGAATITRTGVGHAIGTPAFMSPEQARGASADLDIRSDVFALGVVLDHLIQEHDEAASDAPADLRTIIAKATAEERERRYQSVADLARDVRRFLDHQPIEARPPSRWYAMRLFVRRNRATVAASILVLMLLLAAIAGTSFGLVRARAAERDARAESQRFQAISTFLLDMFRSPDPSDSGKNVKVLDLLREWESEIDRRFANDPEVQASLHSEIGRAYMALASFDLAEPHLLRAMEIRTVSGGEDSARTYTTRIALASLRHRQSRLAEAESLYAGLIPPLMRLRGPDDSETLVARNGHALVLKDLGRFEEAETILRDVVERRLRTLGRNDDATASAMGNLALLLRERGRRDEAETLYREVLEIDIAVNGEEDVRTAITMNNLASLLRSLGRLEEAETLTARTLEIRRKLLDPDHPDVLLSMNNMAMLLVSRGKLAEAELALRETMEAHQRVFGDAHVGTIVVSNNYARVLMDLNRAAEAVPVCERVVASARTVYGANHWRNGWYSAHLGSALAASGRFAEGEPLLLQGYERMRSSVGENDAQTRRAAQLVADAYAAQGDDIARATWAARASEPSSASQPK